MTAHRCLLLLLLYASLSGCAPQALFEGLSGLTVQAPAFVSVKAMDERTVEFSFSESVSLISIAFDPVLAIDSTSSRDSSLLVRFPEALGEGERYVANLLVEDKDRNTLSLLTPFRGRNLHEASLLLTEIRTEYSKPKVEFVEFLVTSGGNLGGFSLVSSESGFSLPLFEFPPCPVAAGEFILVHLRTLDGLWVNETGAIDVSGGTESRDSARDFWVEGAVKRIRKTDALALLDQDGSASDAVLLSEAAVGEWKTDAMLTAAGRLSRLEAWTGAAGPQGQLLPEDGVPSGYTTATRTICRIPSGEDSNSASDWYVTGTSCATPGAVNSTVRYEP